MFFSREKKSWCLTGFEPRTLELKGKHFNQATSPATYYIQIRGQDMPIGVCPSYFNLDV